MISKSLSTSEKRAALHRVVPDLAEFCQQLYPLLVTHSDDFGRQQGDTFTVKHVVDPTSPRSLLDFSRALQALADVELIAWYQVDGRSYVQILNFDPHQQGLHKRTSSAFPPPPGNSGNVSDGQSPLPLVPSEEKGTEPKRTEGKKDTRPEPQSDSSLTTTSTTFLEFPTVGTDGSVWRLTEAQIAEWSGLFPNVDVRQESRQALAWVKAKPGHRKTGRGMAKFLVGWFGRSNDRMRGGGSITPTSKLAPNGLTHRTNDVMAGLGRSSR